MNPLEQIVSDSVDRWLARGGRPTWTATSLWAEFGEFLATAPPEERVAFAALIEGFAEAMRQQFEKTNAEKEK